MFATTKRLAAIATTVVLSAAGLISLASPASAAKGGGGVTTSTAYYVSESNPPHECDSPSAASQSFQTIQAAINCAESNGGAFIINVEPGIYNEQLRLGLAGPDSLIIVGVGGAANTTINGGGNGRTIASYLPDASDCSAAYCTQLTPTIRGFTITGGTGKVIYSEVFGGTFAVGGGIYNGPGSNLTLANDIITGNDVSAVSDGNSGTLFGLGGGVFNDGFAKLTVSSTIVSDNTATAGGGIAVAPLYYACPVELCFSGSVHIQSSSSLVGNHATGFGGGLMTTSPGNVTVSSSTFSGNEALGSDANAYGFPWTGMGGAIASVPWIPYPLLPGGQVTVSGSNLTGNTAAYGGGAIANVGGQLTWTGGTTANNQVTEGPGGALLNWLEASAAIKTPNINMNTASTVGGGIANCYLSSLTLSGGKIQGNTAYSDTPAGGGLGAEPYSPWTAINTSIRGNSPDQTATVESCGLWVPYL